MKILLVVSSYLPNLGGLQSVTSTLAQELVRQGHEVHVITHRYPRSLPANERLDGVPVQRLMFLVPRWAMLHTRRFDLFFASFYYFPLSLGKLLLVLRRWKPDVVNLHFVGAPALFILLTKRLRGFPLVVSLHGDDVEGLAERSHYDRWVFSESLAKADAVTSCSRYLLERALSIVPDVKSKARPVHNGIYIPELSSPQVSAQFVLGVGRLMPSKGWDILVRAWSKYSVVKTYRLMIVGDGPERRALERLAQDLDPTGSIEFFGSQTHNSVLDFIDRALFVITPSRRDTFGLVALEAMALGKPVLATRVGGLPEVLADADAILVPPDDPNALAVGIQEMHAQLARNPLFGTRNRQVAEQFSTGRMVSEYLETYEKAAGLCAA